MIVVWLRGRVHLMVYEPEVAMADSIHVVIGRHEYFRNVIG